LDILIESILNISDIFEPRKFSVTGRRLPSARFVSSSSIFDQDRPDGKITALVAQFGQFMDHDITRAALFQLGNYKWISVNPRQRN
jgi:hypothetical protein